MGIVEPEILLGDEAVALGAIHAGITAAYSYPGTPASEIMEYLVRMSQEAGGFRASWCINEKVAYEEALGVSFAGKRTMVSMKHVGLNVAADPFMNSALTGTGGGLVLAVADDPGMHSSQNEQDSRYYGQFARIFCFEPACHQEAYDMTRAAFDLSEDLSIPVMLRLVTRLSHSRSAVTPREPRRRNRLRMGEARDWTLLPMNARRRFKMLMDKQADLVRLSEQSGFNRLDLDRANRRLGLIASGIGYNYVTENTRHLKNPPSVLKIATYPLPEALLRKLVGHVETVIIVEEGYPFIESTIRGLAGIPGKTIKGKLSGHLPVSGELNPEIVRNALELEPAKTREPAAVELAGRPPQLCKGCPHSDTYNALTQALRHYTQANVFSDIGCYTLGALPPYQAINTCVCMGASVSMAKGGSDAGIRPSVAVIGDSTFGHSGLTPLVDAAASNTDMTVIIVDNGTVAMTGGQPSFSTGERLIRMVRGCGVPDEHIRVIEPLPKNLEANTRTIREELDYEGLSVIIAARECIQEARKRRTG
jgi:indolepyruvate ferredoxin oxidoreductase alpha subunit